MKPKDISTVPTWHGFANSMLNAISDGRKPPLDPETEARIAAEVAPTGSGRIAAEAAPTGGGR